MSSLSKPKIWRKQNSHHANNIKKAGSKCQSVQIMKATDQYIILSWNTCSFTMQQQGGGSHMVNQSNTSYWAVLFCGCLFTVQRFLSLNILVKDTK